jgi:hypothetical protein
MAKKYKYACIDLFNIEMLTSKSQFGKKLHYCQL